MRQRLRRSRIRKDPSTRFLLSNDANFSPSPSNPALSTLGPPYHQITLPPRVSSYPSTFRGLLQLAFPHSLQQRYGLPRLVCTGCSDTAIATIEAPAKWIRPKASRQAPQHQLNKFLIGTMALPLLRRR